MRMASAGQHYEKHLARYYSWLFGDYNDTVKSNRRGKFVLTFSDLVYELNVIDRFIQVKSDPETIFTCFLE